MIIKIYSTYTCLAFITLVLFSSCRPFAFLVFGISAPKPLTTTEVKSAALKLRMDTSALYRIKKSQMNKVYQNRETLPDMRIYDRHGNLSTFWLSTDKDGCRENTGEMVAMIGQDNKYTFLPDPSFCALEEELIGLHEHDFEINSLPPADYYMVIYWGKFLGRFNRKFVQDWMNLAKQNKYVHIYIIYVNIDP